MGKGDRKTKRGKIVKGSYGVPRPHKKKNKEAGVHNKDKKSGKSKK
jgi:30S ribosomal protein S31